MWTILRIFGIIVGTASLLRLASLAGVVEYKDVFVAFIDRLSDIIELGYLLDVIEKFIVHPVFEWIRSFGWHLPELQPHWRSVFTLTWLMLAAIGRHERGITVLLLPLGLVCALIGAAAVGTMPVTSDAVSSWPAAALCLFMAGIAVIDGDVRATLIFLAAAAINAAVRWFLPPGKDATFPLLALAGIVGLAGLMFLVVGFRYARGTFRERMASSTVAMGLDILSVMGLALGIGYLMMK